MDDANDQTAYTAAGAADNVEILTAEGFRPWGEDDSADDLSDEESGRLADARDW